MARRPPSSPSPQSANLTVEQMRRGIERINRRIAEVRAFDPSMMHQRFDTRATVLGTGIEATLASVFGHDTVEYKRYLLAQRLDAGPLSVGGRPDLPFDVQRYYAKGKQRSLLLLQQAVQGLEEDIADREHLASPSSSQSVIQHRDVAKVFVVHGHDEGARESVARFLEKLGFTPIVLHEQANQGRTVIEKVEAHGDVGFAVVLLTPDDEGCKHGEAPEPRARQNVLLELGYFIGRLGRSKVCALKRGVVSVPSDFAGVVWEDMDDAGGWKQKLARELEAAGGEIDWNKVMRS